MKFGVDRGGLAMNRPILRRRKERSALEHVAAFARGQLFQAVDELLESFVGPLPPSTAPARRSAESREGFESQHQRFCDIAEALTQWHSIDAFLADDGLPKPLPRTGKRSLTSLSQGVVTSKATAKRLVSDLLQFGVVEASSGMYLPARRSAVLGRANALSLAYATIAATRLLRTISHNVSTDTSPLFERQVVDVAIRATDLPMYLRFVEQQAQYLIDATDDWLSRRGIGSESVQDRVKVGVGAFVWADVLTQSVERRPSRSRRKIQSHKLR